VDLSHLVDSAGVVENSFGHRGFAGVDVSDDADVACFIQLAIRGHEKIQSPIRYLKSVECSGFRKAAYPSRTLNTER
jgi:hypothetical protein